MFDNTVAATSSGESNTLSSSGDKTITSTIPDKSITSATPAKSKDAIANSENVYTASTTPTTSAPVTTSISQPNKLLRTDQSDHQPKSRAADEVRRSTEIKVENAPSAFMQVRKYFEKSLIIFMSYDVIFYI